MKQRYTITVSGYEMNVLSDDSPEEIEEIVAALDRSIRTITARSRNLPRSEAFLLCALDACSERRRAVARVHALEDELYGEGGETARLKHEVALLRRYIEQHGGKPPVPAAPSGGDSASGTAGGGTK